MRIGTEEEFIAINAFERADDASFHADEVLLSIQVKLKELAVSYNSVCILRADFDNFVQEFAQFEQHQTGTVALESFNPNEFSLSIGSRPRHSDLMVQVGLSRFHYTGPVEWNSRVTGGFRLNPSTLASILHSLKEFQLQPLEALSVQ